nr:hypothetical protein [Tanacetum cinerariifolium]
MWWMYSGGDVFDLIGDVDPTDEDGDIEMGDSTGVSASLDNEIFSGGRKCRESNIGTNLAKITKKGSKPDKNEHEIVKSAQKPDPKILLCSKSGGDVFDLIGDVDPTDEDGDIEMGDSTGVSASLDSESSREEGNVGNQTLVIVITDMCTDLAKITKKGSKPDKNELDIVKSAQKPDPKILLCSKVKTKANCKLQGLILQNLKL